MMPRSYDVQKVSDARRPRIINDATGNSNLVAIEIVRNVGYKSHACIHRAAGG
jgi:hypothetical protein